MKFKKKIRFQKKLKIRKIKMIKITMKIIMKKKFQL